MMMQMQRESTKRLELMQQQMLEQQEQHREERQRDREEHRTTLRRMEERMAVLAVPRPTVAENAPPVTTAQVEHIPVHTDSEQSQPVDPIVILRTPARVTTPASRLNLAQERSVPEGDDGDDGDDDNPQDPPPNARSGRRADSALGAQPATVGAQRTALILPAVTQLCQDKLIQNGRVLLDWKREIEDRIEVAEFNDGGVPYDFARRFLIAKMTMDLGVREYINAYQKEVKNGQPQTIQSWEQLMLVLETHYAPARDAEEAAREFYQGKMLASETMEQFVHRIGGIYNRIAREELPGSTASDIVILMIDEKRYPDLIRNIREEQRKHKLANGGVGMDFIALRNKLPEMARAEPNQSMRLELDALKAEILRMAKGGSSNKNGKSTEKINAVQQFRSYTSMTDEELKKKKWTPERIRALREGACFNCYEKGHMATECAKPKKAASAQGN